jgi:hypothetical protein
MNFKGEESTKSKYINNFNFSCRCSTYYSDCRNTFNEGRVKIISLISLSCIIFAVSLTQLAVIIYLLVYMRNKLISNDMQYTK